MCISAWVRDKIGVKWGIERGWYTGEGTGNAKAKVSNWDLGSDYKGRCWPPTPTTANNNRSTGQRTVRRAGDCRRYGRSYHMKVAIRSGRYGMLVSSNSTGRNTGSSIRAVWLMYRSEGQVGYSSGALQYIARKER